MAIGQMHLSKALRAMFDVVKLQTDCLGEVRKHMANVNSFIAEQEDFNDSVRKFEEATLKAMEKGL